jgi:type I restriction enzyme S subunit
MNKELKKAIVPRLRFPEFDSSGEWLKQPMGELFEFQSNNSLSRDKLTYESGSVKNIHYGDIHTKFKTLFRIKDELVPYIIESESLERVKPESYCIEGDMVFADASEDLEDIGKSIELVELNNEKLLSGLHTILARPKEKKLATGFSGYLFKSVPMRSHIKKEAQGAKVLGISAKKLAKIDLLFPEDKKEQKKITDCLSSLDDLITAQNDKVSTLRSYKKGLLQQLFPQEGETVPRLRFPEFRNDGKWKFKLLGDIAENLDSKRIPITEGDRIKGDIPYIGASGIIDYVKDYIFDERLLCVSEDGANLIARAYPIAFSVSGKVWVNNHAHVLRFNEEYAQIFVEQYLNFINLEKYITGQAQPKLNKGKLDSIEIPIPFPVEQKKIASCLLSIERVITFENDKVIQLKKHKNGLLKQLFPSVEEENNA